VNAVCVIFERAQRRNAISPAVINHGVTKAEGHSQYPKNDALQSSHLLKLS